MMKNFTILLAVIAVTTLFSCSKLKEEEFYGEYPDDAETQTDNESQETMNDSDSADQADSDSADTTDSETTETTDKDEPDEQTDDNNSTDEENPVTDDNNPATDDDQETGDDNQTADDDQETDNDNPVTDDDQETDNDNPVTDDDQGTDNDNPVTDDDQETDNDNQTADDDQETGDDNQTADDDQETGDDNQTADDDQETDNDNPITDDDPIIPGCTPDCNGKECGPDGCGGICKTDCGTDAACNAEQTRCVPYNCEQITVNKLRERDTLPMGEHRDKYIYKATYTDSNNATSSDEDFKFQINYDESLPAVVDLSNFHDYKCIFRSGSVCFYIQNSTKLYFQQSGTIDISTLDTSNGNISAALTNVRLVETGFVLENERIYEIPGGKCLEIKNETLNYTAPVYSAK